MSGKLISYEQGWCGVQITTNKGSSDSTTRYQCVSGAFVKWWWGEIGNRFNNKRFDWVIVFWGAEACSWEMVWYPCVVFKECRVPCVTPRCTLVFLCNRDRIKWICMVSIIYDWKKINLNIVYIFHSFSVYFSLSHLISLLSIYFHSHSIWLIHIVLSLAGRQPVTPSNTDHMTIDWRHLCQFASQWRHVLMNELEAWD